MNKIIFTICFLFLIISCFAQIKNGKHEVSLAGGYLLVDPDTDLNKHGFSINALYSYIPIKWFGIQTGIQYNYTQNYCYGKDTIHAPLQIPLYIVLFPKFKFSLTGGVYYEIVTGKLVEDAHYMEKQNVWGYELGIRKNWKHIRLKLAYKKGITPWYHEKPGAHAYPSKKSRAFNATIEIPIWRNRY